MNDFIRPHHSWRPSKCWLWKCCSMHTKWRAVYPSWIYIHTHGMRMGWMVYAYRRLGWWIYMEGCGWFIIETVPHLRRQCQCPCQRDFLKRRLLFHDMDYLRQKHAAQCLRPKYKRKKLIKLIGRGHVICASIHIYESIQCIRVNVCLITFGHYYCFHLPCKWKQ